MLSTDAQTAQEALLPQPSYGTVNVYTLSFPPDLTNLKSSNEKYQFRFYELFNISLVSQNCSNVSQAQKLCTKAVESSAR